MKKYFVFAAAALVALASCSKVVEDPTPEQELTFLALNYASGTKATNVDFYSAGSFGVFAYYTPGAWASTKSDMQAYMTDTEITKQTVNSADVWKAKTGTYYWPRAGKLSFIGYYPYSATAAAVTTGDTPVITFSGYTVASTPTTQAAKVTKTTSDPVTVTDDQNDLMVADWVANQSSNEMTDNEPASHTSTTGVAMLFHHLLAKVKFEAKVNDLKVALPLSAVVTDVHIEKIANVGDWNGTAWTPTAARITSSDAIASATAAAAGAKVGDVLTGTATPIGTEYYVLPQTPDKSDASTAVISVSFTVYSYHTVTAADVTANTYAGAVEGDKVVVEAKSYTKTVAIADLTAAWAKNTIYTYQLAIDCFDGEIYFTPKVEDWTTADATAAPVN